jgi:hypothetical protein
MSICDVVWTAPRQRHRNMPKRNRDGLIIGVILAFSERLELAKSSRQRGPPVTSGVGGKADVKGVEADMPLNPRRNRRPRPI